MSAQLTLVVDSNILFASLIKPGENAKLLFSDRLQLFASEWLFEEFRNNKPDLLRKTNRSPEEFELFLELLEEKIEVIPKSEFEQWLEEAEKCSTVNDFPFAALAKSLNCPVWSNDKDFKEAMQESGFVSVLNTGDVLEKLEYR